MRFRTHVALFAASMLGLAALCLIGGGTLYVLGGFSDGDVPSGKANAAPMSCGRGATPVPDGKLTTVASLTTDQTRYASVIISVGQQRRVPPRGWVIAIAAALQESGLHNLPNLGSQNDHDSLGLFQQRPSSGWGTPDQLMDPAYAAGKFYDKLVTIRGWETMTLTNAAQAVQRSAYPDAYAKHEPRATEIVNALANGAARDAGSLVDTRCRLSGDVESSGWVAPVTRQPATLSRPSPAKRLRYPAAPMDVIARAHSSSEIANRTWRFNTSGASFTGTVTWNPAHSSW